MSSKEKQVEQLTTYMANFVSHIGKVLPDDIIAKLDELAEKEDSPLSKVIYETMKKNQVLAKMCIRDRCTRHPKPSTWQDLWEATILFTTPG